MLPVDEARAQVLATVSSMPTERVPLEDALGRVSAVDVVAATDVPPWDNSAMDGYAVRAEDTDADGAVFEVLGTGMAGEAPDLVVTPTTAMKIMTGAPMPAGADAVVVREDAEVLADGRVRLTEKATPGRYVRWRGDDVTQGEVIVLQGTTLLPAHLGLIASTGGTTVRVARQPRVAILTTGDEVVRGGGSLGPGQIYGSNHLTLAGLVRQAGAVPVDLGHVRDDLDGLRAALHRALQADVVLTTGGVSMGDRDLLREAMADAGVHEVFWKVRMKPGKPLAFGVASPGGRSVPVFGLPGNPVSCMVNLLQFVRPWLRMAMGDRHPHLPVVHATCVDDLRSRTGRARLERVLLAAGPDGWTCASTGSQSSGVLTSMAAAHGLVLIGPDEAGPVVGERVRVQLLDTGFLAAADVRFGW